MRKLKYYSDLAATVFSEIDEMIVKLNPVVIGAGIPVFSRAISPTNLELVDRKIYNNGFLLLHFKCRSQAIAANFYKSS